MIVPDFDELIRIGSRPNRLEVASGRPALAAVAGAYASPFRGQGLSFQEVREYRPGDDIRNIDWRVTARANKPHMKIFTEDRERTVMLCIDANPGMRFGTRGTFKSVQAARAAALLGRLAHGSHDRVGCLLFGDVPGGVRLFRPSRSRSTLWQTLRLLSLPPSGMPPQTAGLGLALERLDHAAPTGSLIFLIGDFYAADAMLENNLLNLRRRCDVVLVRINDPADGAIPAIGTILFTDEEGRTAQIDTGSRAGREAYHRAWQTQRDRFDAACRRNGFSLIDLHTGGDVHDDLVPALRRIGGGGRR